MKPKDFINFCSLSRTASSSFEHTSLSTNAAAKAEIKNLVEKIQELEEKLDKKKEDDEISEFERTKRAVKEEASKSKVDIDILHEKLIVFENLARKRNHELYINFKQIPHPQ
jgi:hypothetical protein